MIHTYFIVTISYDAKILTPQKTPKMFKFFPAISYPGAILGFCAFVFYQSSKMNKELDRKYTPLWKHLVKEMSKAETIQK